MTAHNEAWPPKCMLPSKTAFVIPTLAASSYDCFTCRQIPQQPIFVEHKTEWFRHRRMFTDVSTSRKNALSRNRAMIKSSYSVCVLRRLPRLPQLCCSTQVFLPAICQAWEVPSRFLSLNGEKEGNTACRIVKLTKRAASFLTQTNFVCICQERTSLWCHVEFGE